MRPEPNGNLLVAGVIDFARWVERATRLGAEDFLEGFKRKPGRDVVVALGIRKWRVGHVRYLQRAYAAGWWHAETMAKEAR